MRGKPGDAGAPRRPFVATASSLFPEVGRRLHGMEYAFYD